MDLIPENAAEHCPGTQSQSAGKAVACEGCPNQNVCAKGENKLPDDASLTVIQQRLDNVKHKVLILSGKGGVGKSTVTSTLARIFAQNTENNIAIMDIDICGPSIPLMLGVEGEKVHQSGSGWSPIFVEDNISLMSVGFLTNADDAVIWRGPKKNGLIKQFLCDVDWGELDFLFIDTPPGTGDEHLSIATLMAKCKLDGAIIVTTPQDVALVDVRKEVNFCKRIGISIIGIIENMSWFVCPNCKGESTIFPATSGGARKMAEEMDVPFLGSIPVEQQLAKSCDEGSNFFNFHSNTKAGTAYLQIANEIKLRLKI